MIFSTFSEISWFFSASRAVSILIFNVHIFVNIHSARHQTFRTAQSTRFWAVWMLLTILISNFVFFGIFNLSKLYHCNSAPIAHDPRFVLQISSDGCILADPSFPQNKIDSALTQRSIACKRAQLGLSDPRLRSIDRKPSRSQAIMTLTYGRLNLKRNSDITDLILAPSAQNPPAIIGMERSYTIVIFSH